MNIWAPHFFYRSGLESGCDVKVLSRLLAEGLRLQSLGLPVVFTLNHLATLCGVPFRFLHDVIKRQGDPYRIFKLRKRGGGYRNITIPAPRLLCVQRWIHTNILSKCPPTTISTAYAQGCGPLENAARHVGASWLVKIDIQQFFESISERQVYHVFRQIGYPALLSFEMARICTRRSNRAKRYRSKRWRSEISYGINEYHNNHIGHLPQGAPTSPLLANLVCKQLDMILIAVAKREACVVSRYADDIVFSGTRFDRSAASKLILELDHHLNRFGFRRNAQKTHIVSPGARKIVTGLLVDREAPALTREFRDRIRLHLYFGRKFGIAQHCKRRGFRSLLGFRNHLKGLISYARNVDPQFGEECERQFDALPWGILAEF